MASFSDLGLREPLLRALEEEGLERPTALQEAAIPVLRREGNMVARVASGSGKTLTYGLGIMDRLEPRAGGAEAAEAAGDAEAGEDDAAEPPRTRALVLVPTGEEARRAALSLVHYAQSAGLTVSASGAGWGTPGGAADVLVATPHDVLEAVRVSAVKLDAVEAVVVDGASHVEALGGWEAVETLFDHVPRDAQRVLFTSQMTPAVEDLVDRRVKRALRYPTEPAVPEAQAAAPSGVVGYVPVAEREKVDVVARLLGGDRGGEPAPVLFCRTDERAANLAEELTLRGFLVGEPDDADADAAVVGAGATPDAIAEATGERPGAVVSFDVPADEATLRARHGGGEAGYVLVEPRELDHLRDTARRAGLDPRPAGISGEEPRGSAEVRAFRGELRRALGEEDIGAYTLLLEPLFEEFTATEVAAAAAALLRRRRPAQQEPVPAAAPAAAAPHTATAERPQRTTRAPRAAPDVGPAPSASSRLFVSVGERDGARAGDLVGAIAGEADIPGTDIGRIEIRDTFSIVEVPAGVAERVIKALNGTTIKGRSVRVDFDRGAARKEGPPRGGAPRGGPRGGGPRGGAGGARSGGPVRRPRPRE